MKDSANRSAAVDIGAVGNLPQRVEAPVDENRRELAAQ
jgi:hypothetical protein